MSTNSNRAITNPSANVVAELLAQCAADYDAHMAIAVVDTSAIDSAAQLWNDALKRGENIRCNGTPENRRIVGKIVSARTQGILAGLERQTLPELNNLVRLDGEPVETTKRKRAIARLVVGRMLGQQIVVIPRACSGYYTEKLPQASLPAPTTPTP